MTNAPAPAAGQQAAPAQAQQPRANAQQQQQMVAAVQQAVQQQDPNKLKVLLAQMQSGNFGNVPGGLWDAIKAGNWADIGSIVGQFLGQASKAPVASGVALGSAAAHTAGQVAQFPARAGWQAGQAFAGKQAVAGGDMSDDLRKVADLKAAWQQEFNPFQRQVCLDEYIAALEPLAGVVPGPASIAKRKAVSDDRPKPGDYIGLPDGESHATVSEFQYDTHEGYDVLDEDGEEWNVVRDPANDNQERRAYKVKVGLPKENAAGAGMRKHETEDYEGGRLMHGASHAIHEALALLQEPEHEQMSEDEFVAEVVRRVKDQHEVERLAPPVQAAIEEAARQHYNGTEPGHNDSLTTPHPPALARNWSAGAGMRKDLHSDWHQKVTADELERVEHASPDNPVRFAGHTVWRSVFHPRYGLMVDIGPDINHAKRTKVTDIADVPEEYGSSKYPGKAAAAGLPDLTAFTNPLLEQFLAKADDHADEDAKLSAGTTKWLWGIMRSANMNLADGKWAAAASNLNELLAYDGMPTDKIKELIAVLGDMEPGTKKRPGMTFPADNLFDALSEKMRDRLKADPDNGPADEPRVDNAARDQLLAGPGNADQDYETMRGAMRHKAAGADLRKGTIPGYVTRAAEEVRFQREAHEGGGYNMPQREGPPVRDAAHGKNKAEITRNLKRAEARLKQMVADAVEDGYPEAASVLNEFGLALDKAAGTDLRKGKYYLNAKRISGSTHAGGKPRIGGTYIISAGGGLDEDRIGVLVNPSRYSREIENESGRYRPFGEMKGEVALKDIDTGEIFTHFKNYLREVKGPIKSLEEVKAQPDDSEDKFNRHEMIDNGHEAEFNPEE